MDPPHKLGLPPILTLRHLAQLTGANYSYLRDIITRQHDGYRSFAIKKRGGGQRSIAAPEPMLAAVQRWIATKILLKRPVHYASQAYSLGASSINCAKRHLCARWLIKVDIHDFFESISERRAYFVFRECGYQPLVSFELARLCTRATHREQRLEDEWYVNRTNVPPGLVAYKSSTLGHLPQGAPTSPMLSNLTSKALDDNLQKLADKYGLLYTRYSDDITFSTGEQLTRKAANTLVIEAQHILAAFGHELHRRKVTIAPPGARKVVLGLLVDGTSLKLTRNFRNRVSDHVRGIAKFGLSQHAQTRHFASLWGLVRHVEGLLAYANAIDPTFAAPLKDKLSVALATQGWSQA